MSYQLVSYPHIDGGNRARQVSSVLSHFFSTWVKRLLLMEKSLVFVFHYQLPLPPNFRAHCHPPVASSPPTRSENLIIGHMDWWQRHNIFFYFFIFSLAKPLGLTPTKTEMKPCAICLDISAPQHVQAKTIDTFNMWHATSIYACGFTKEK